MKKIILIPLLYLIMIMLTIYLRKDSLEWYNEGGIKALYNEPLSFIFYTHGISILIATSFFVNIITVPLLLKHGADILSGRITIRNNNPNN